MNNQELAFEKLSKLKVGALFMEMGTGKTKVALDLIASKKDKVDYILWICPFSIKSEIEQERQKWHPELSIEIVGFETISQSDKKYLELLYKVNYKKTVSYIKNIKYNKYIYYIYSTLTTLSISIKSYLSFSL